MTVHVVLNFFLRISASVLVKDALKERPDPEISTWVILTSRRRSRTVQVECVSKKKIRVRTEQQIRQHSRVSCHKEHQEGKKPNTCPGHLVLGEVINFREVMGEESAGTTGVGKP